MVQIFELARRTLVWKHSRYVRLSKHRMAAKNDRILRAIAYFKLVNGTALFILAIGVLHLLHRDVGEMLEHWLDKLRIDPGNKYAASLLSKAGVLDDKRIEILGALTFCYSAMFLTEGVGLFLQKRWAEWFSVIATASFIPIEILEVCRHISAVKIILVIANTAIVGVLVYRLRKPTT
jgi:uncharacterized membrane protein (DUF2068 family)